MNDINKDMYVSEDGMKLFEELFREFIYNMLAIKTES